MVAVTKRCQTCRSRKIKCDQQWPSCGQCEISNRKCPGPPTRVKFMPVQSKTEKEKKVVLAPKTAGDKTTVPATGAKEERTHRPSNTSSNRQSPKLLVKLAYGLPRSVDSDPASLVARELIVSLESTPLQPDRPSFLGACSFIRDVPRMLESSDPLTATVACCLDASSKDRRLPRNERSLNPRLYGLALQTINHALQDATKRTCVGTFLAVVLIGRLESLLAPRELARIPCWSVHAGGISELLKERGTLDAVDRTVFEVMLENFGPIMSHAVLQDQDCFLASARWQEAICGQANRTRNSFDDVLCRVFAQLAFLPSLIKKARRWRRGDEDAFIETLVLAESMSDELQDLGTSIDNDILPYVKTGPPEWLDLHAPIGSMFVNPTHNTCRILSWHAVLTLVVNKVLIAIFSYENISRDDHLILSSPEDLRERSVKMSQRVWMLSDEARRKGLVGFYFYPGALFTTYDCAASDCEREWIVDLLNEILESTWSQTKWTHEGARNVCMTLAGEL